MPNTKMKYITTNINKKCSNNRITDYKIKSIANFIRNIKIKCYII